MLRDEFRVSATFFMSKGNRERVVMPTFSQGGGGAEKNRSSHVFDRQQNPNLAVPTLAELRVPAQNISCRTAGHWILITDIQLQLTRPLCRQATQESTEYCCIL